ncbi:hypothetical protein PAXINDRAFT_19909 [Paxillus involutus ATCC 200175]|uniref:Unplaced genomic scaffold PAXINscaffold_790, whole genome shotgun sequence n=1 Tax=Paxillus involutus ATCC 200175 TaxID=664439 RepID=A0A0C9TFK7_PAXIN|nr:hypothetical protein PAXINDRAFT_19909 [Paxillus involutus ATCC 200175]
MIPTRADDQASETNDRQDHYQALLKSLDGTSGGRKRKQSDPLDPYIFAARFFPLNFDPFADFGAVLRAGIAAEFEERGGLHDDSADDDDEARVTRAYHIQLFNNWAKTVPGFSDLITKFETDPEVLDSFIDTMVTAAYSGRTDDTGSLKYDGLIYMLKDPIKDKIEPPIPKTRNGSKADRGWNHGTIARLLCPARDVEDFDVDPQAYTDLVKCGKKKPTATKFPSFLYDMVLFDHENKHTGFLHGHTLVQTWRHIFTGPSSAFHKSRRATKPSKGRMHGLQAPNIRNIMYAAVQAYFTMSNEETWTSNVGTVNLADMYYTVVDMIERKSEELWVKELLDFWKDEAPGLMLGGPSKRRRLETMPSNSDSEDDLAGFDNNAPPSSASRQRRRSPTRNILNESNHGTSSSPIGDSESRQRQRSPTTVPNEANHSSRLPSSSESRQRNSRSLAPSRTTPNEDEHGGGPANGSEPRQRGSSPMRTAPNEESHNGQPTSGSSSRNENLLERRSSSLSPPPEDPPIRLPSPPQAPAQDPTTTQGRKGRKRAAPKRGKRT